MFSFTLMGGRVDSSLNRGNVPYIFRLKGQNYHSIGSFLIANRCQPIFSQLYIYDTKNETSLDTNVPEDDRTALRLAEVVILSRSGRSSQKSNFSRTGLRLGNRTSRDLRDLGTCLRLEYDTGASGYFWHTKRCKTGERREKMNKRIGCPRILFIGGWSLGVRGAYCPKRHCLGIRSARVRVSTSLGVRGAYLGSDR
uniref:Uncharacterized protein n=1 Tax=Lactuca sativa TaxID=4236 RepID=A0A9R1XWC7_LACSA|nr:hypothetical protein LSAT_V11C100029730 [Lactuca sativa]